MARKPFVDPDLSRLSCQERLLQEAEDPAVPLFERLRFLATSAAALDEFLATRATSLRRLLRLTGRARKKLPFSPQKLIGRLDRMAADQQLRAGRLLAGELVPGLEAHGIRLADERGVPPDLVPALRAYFDERVRPHLEATPLDADGEPLHLRRGLYLVAELRGTEDAPAPRFRAPEYALLRLPVDLAPRFVHAASAGGRRLVLFLDDLLRLFLPSLFPDRAAGPSFSVEMIREAPPDALAREDGDDRLARLLRRLERKDGGRPCRLRFDAQAPAALVACLKRRLDLADEDLVPGARYHRLADLTELPRPAGAGGSYPELPPLAHPALEDAVSLLDAVEARDHLLHFPYQRFDYLPRLLEEASRDGRVEELWIGTGGGALAPRAARALRAAAARGTGVSVFHGAADERKAAALREAGVHVVEAPRAAGSGAAFALLARRHGEELRLIAWLGTGDFDEHAAATRADVSLLTADPRLTADLRELVRFLAGETEEPRFEQLLVSPGSLRGALGARIDEAVAAAEEGREARILLKLNRLTDEKLAARLYRASRAGVHVELLVRDECLLAGGGEEHHGRLEVTSLVDHLLEHARGFVFEADGETHCYLSTAELTRADLNTRVEFAFPILDAQLRDELRALVDLQRADNAKTRILDAQLRNRPRRVPGEPLLRAQLETYRWLERRLCAPEPPEALPHAASALIVADLLAPSTEEIPPLPSPGVPAAGPG